MSAQQVHQCLQRSNAKYSDSAKKDILGALNQFKDMGPMTENFMFPDGKRRNAFKLVGTIPINYKGNLYNIPISVILWDTHPYYAPLCYVTPTSKMIIKESEHVNKEGKVFLPYLNEWRFPGHDLSGLLQISKCPVFARKTTGSTPVTTSSNITTPYPTTLPSIPTPYPATATSTPFPTPYPAVGNSGYNPYVNIPSATPYPLGCGYQQPAPPRPNLPRGTIQPDTIRVSVLSAIEEKVRSKLRDKMGTNSAELASIQSTGAELREGQQKLKKVLDELEGQKKGLQTVVEFYSTKKEELSTALKYAGGSESPPIDDAIDAATPLHRQIVLNYAKDLTCDDVIYALGQSLKSGNMNLSEYLRRVRDISREQFIYRATMQKCRRVAGLPV
ncbi:unnamed protein product [Caenorhabditis bovis]|uniref:Tumor susceptibility gene 101 protein n=1 Tax=Caenorhabditis bovis TaxID=2654633 RepID=A0A8S1F9R3_9PELO|nr:unnamed protein product [Caenorhabditis bovis]